MALTLLQVRETLWPLGLRISKWDGEYRVNFVRGDEATAYYTNDLEDALWTGLQMASRGETRRKQGHYGI